MAPRKQSANMSEKCHISELHATVSVTPPRRDALLPPTHQNATPQYIRGTHRIATLRQLYSLLQLRTATARRTSLPAPVIERRLN